MGPKMHSLWIVLVGVFIVLGGVLVLRLHAFLSLLLAALAVAVLTPQAAVQRYAIEKNRVSIHAIAASENRVELKLSPEEGAIEGARYLVLRQVGSTNHLEQIAVLEIEQFTVLKDAGEQPLAVASPIESLGSGPLHKDDIVIDPLALTAAQALAKQTAGERVATALGTTCAQIGILIAMAAIIGKCLLDSGAADRIVRTALAVVGEGGAPLAFVGSGFLLGIPVFFDTVFYLMIPLGKALRVRTGRNYLLYVLTIVAGATMAHSLVPPTPGPLFVAEQLKVDLGTMILAGCAVGLMTSSVGLVFATAVNRRRELPLRESPDLTHKDLEDLAHRDQQNLPPLSISLLPILLPVLLIAGYTVLDSLDVEGLHPA